jgi:hypothetical protein
MQADLHVFHGAQERAPLGVLGSDLTLDKVFGSFHVISVVNHDSKQELHGRWE